MDLRGQKPSHTISRLELNDGTVVEGRVIGRDAGQIVLAGGRTIDVTDVKRETITVVQSA
jgi:hypothetical protein